MEFTQGIIIGKVAFSSMLPVAWGWIWVSCRSRSLLQCWLLLCVSWWYLTTHSVLTYRQSMHLPLSVDDTWVCSLCADDSQALPSGCNWVEVKKLCLRAYNRKEFRQKLSLLECKTKCVNAGFKCRSFDYKPSSKKCVLSNSDRKNSELFSYQRGSWNYCEIMCTNSDLCILLLWVIFMKWWLEC